MAKQKKHFDLAPPLEERGIFDHAEGGYQKPDPWDRHKTLRRGVHSLGDLPGYAPTSPVVIAESKRQALAVRAVEKEANKPRRKFIIYGASILAAAGATAGVTVLGHKYIAHEKAPWDNPPTITKPNH